MNNYNITFAKEVNYETEVTREITLKADNDMHAEALARAMCTQKEFIYEILYLLKGNK